VYVRNKILVNSITNYVCRCCNFHWYL